MVANYGTGAVAVMPIGEDGRLQPVSQLVPLEGTPGPDPKEQASSHPHAVIFDPTGQFVIVPDKGFDRTFFFRFQRRPADRRRHRFCRVGARRRASARHVPSHAAGAVREQRAQFDGDGVRLGRGTGDASGR